MEPELAAYLDWLRGHGVSFTVADDLAHDRDFDGELVKGEETVRRLVLMHGEEEMPPLIEHRSPALGLSADHATRSVAIELLRRDHVEPMVPLWDIGCGTGVLGTLGGMLGAMPVFGTDVDPAAIDLARRTSGDTLVEVEWLEGSLLEPIPEDDEDEEPERPLVIANLPHKPCPDRTSLSLAQDGGPEGDSVFAAFTAQAAQRLPAGSRVLFFLHSLPHPRLLSGMAVNFDLRLLSWKQRWIAEGEFGPLLPLFRERASRGIAWMGEEGGRPYLLSGVWEAVRRGGAG